MDHPGFVARRMVDDNTLHADFYGGVLRDYVEGAKVRFFDGDREIPGTVLRTTPDKRRPAYPATATIRLRFRVPIGAPGMFDLGAGRIRGSKFYSRVCDDLGGAAACLALLDKLLKKPPRTTTAVLLTRAEEDAFIGAIASVLYPSLLRMTDRVISIECSAMQPYARQGDGVILRVGDRTSIFDSAMMYFINRQAEALAKQDKRFKFQRALMPGGTCEATVFDAWGYTTGALCVPLGNYHNMDRQRKKLSAEFVDLADWNNMVKLFVQLARNAHEFESDLGPLKRRVEKHFRTREALLTQGRTRGRRTGDSGRHA
jgi:endoglucanase